MHPFVPHRGSPSNLVLAGSVIAAIVVGYFTLKVIAETLTTSLAAHPEIDHIGAPIPIPWTGIAIVILLGILYYILPQPISQP
jgi:hypothetical protein